MRTTGKGLYKWMKTQENVRWPKMGGGMIVYFTYQGVMCCGMVDKTYGGSGQLYKTGLAIRPMQQKDDIGNGVGETVYKVFCDEAHKKT